MATRTWTEKSLIEACKSSITYSQVLKKLNLRPTGGNYDHIKRIIGERRIDISHFKKQGWSKDARLKEWADFKRPNNMKRHLVSERGHSCESCNLSEWFGKPIVLELHHLDGNRTHNAADNLQLLCPNCHSMTDNWRGKKLKDTEVA